MNLRELLGRALSSRSVDPRFFVERAPPAVVPRSSFDAIALGKAAGRMMDGLLESWGTSLRAALVVLPDDSPAPRDDGRVRVLRAAHPLPDERSVMAGDAVLDFARNGAGEALYVLVSGGASSLVLAPASGVTLEVARAVTQTLLTSGADVRDTNTVRRHISRVHGGALLRASSPRPTVTIVESDVIDGQPYDVGSGPSVPDPTTIEDARRILARFAPTFAPLLGLDAGETLKPADPAASRSTIVTTGGPAQLAEALASQLRDSGLAVQVLDPSLGDVAALAEEYARRARTMKPGEAIVRVAEPSLRVGVSRPGAGGRCGHLASLVAAALPPGVSFLAAASDGVDGSGGTSGAVVDSESFSNPAALRAAVAAFDTGPLLVACGAALPVGPTGLNLTDVHALVCAARSEKAEPAVG